MRTTRPATALLLRRAAELIDRDGWQQGQYGNSRTGYCALGAILAAADATHTDAGDAIDTLHTVVGGITQWNDHRDRTKTDVTITLRRTAHQLTARA